MSVSPKIAASSRRIKSTGRFSTVVAVSAPAANSKESPGRKGSRTNPVSQKIIAKSRKYVKYP